MKKQSRQKSINKRFMRNTWVAVLSVVLAVTLAVGLIPRNVVQAEVISDLDTSTKYTESLGDNASTEYAGRIWTDKSVYSEDKTFELFGGGSATIENDSDFLVAYSALATSQEITGSSKAPVDVVFIIDISGSMSNSDSKMDNGYSRIYNTIVAVNDAIDELMDMNEYTRVSVVAFSDTSRVLLPLDRYTKTRSWGTEVDYFTLNRSTASSQTTTLSTNAINSRGRTISDSTNVTGGTNIQRGIYEGMNVLVTEDETTATIDGTTVTRVPSVVLLSDGAPTYSSNSTSWWSPANNNSHGPGSSPYVGNGMKALMTGAYMKAAVDRNYEVAGTPLATTLYTVGMGISELENYTGWGNNRTYTGEQDLAYITLNPGGYWDADNDMAEDVVDAWDEYTDGDRTNPSLRVNSDTSYTFTHPTTNDIFTQNDKDALETLVDDYYDANNASAVTSVFENIVSKISIDAAEVPTEIKGSNPVTDGYITYMDPIGKYMEVKDVKAILYAGTVFEQKTKTTSGNGLTTTYVFEGEVHSPIYGEQNIRNIIVTVTKDAEGSETLTVKVPAAAIPVRVNYVALNSDGTVQSHTNNGAYPTRVLYTVGLKDDLKTTADDGTEIVDTEKIDDAYEIANTNEDGTINFYSNLYTGTNVINGSTAGDATVEFEPAHTNPFYYIQENMAIYGKDNRGNFYQIPASQRIDPEGTYYYREIYYHGTGVVTEETERTGAQLLTTDIINRGGYWYRAAGSPRLNRILEFEGTKIENNTVTAADFYAPTFEYAEGSTDPYEGKFVVYLGNNGVLNMPATGALEIAKEVVVPEGMTPATDSFRFVVDFNGAAAVQGTFPYTVVDADGNNVSSGQIADGGTITLKDGQVAKITKLAPGTTYTVTEAAVAGFATESQGTTGTIVASTTSQALFTNTYSVETLTFPTEGGFNGTKVLKGRDWVEGTDEYTFFLTPYNNAPLPEGYDAEAGVTVTTAVENGNIWEAAFGFDSIEFTEPGVYRYTIVEKEPESDAFLPGMSYSRALYRIVITVVDNGNGTLSASADVQQLYTDAAEQLFTYDADNNIVLNEGQEAQDEIVFTNTYSADSIVRTPVATKTYTDNSGNKPLVSGMFSFKFEAVGVVENGTVTAGTADQVPMPEENGTRLASVITENEGGNITFPSITFDHDDLQGEQSITFRYKMSEVKGDIKGMTYDENEYFIDVTISVDASNNALVFNAVYPNEDRIINFVNSYTPQPAVAEIKGIKTLNGRDMKDGEEFKFSLSANAATSMAIRDGAIITDSDNTAVVSGGKNGDATEFTFGEFTFTKPGNYRFYVTETAGNEGGVTYDSHTSTVTITVVDNNGVLEPTVVYSDGTMATFVNTYKATFTDEPVSLDGTKNLTGKTLLAGEFYFKVEDVNAGTVTNVTHTVDETVENGVYTGSIQFLDNVTYSKAGTYVYNISEQIPDPKVKGTTYDESKYKYTVVVIDNLDGDLVVESTKLEIYDTDNSAWVNASNIVFNNTYVPEEKVVTVPVIKKVLTGNRHDALQAGEFEFELSVVSANPADGIILPAVTTVTNDADGNISFGDMKFTKAGTYVIKASEVLPDGVAAGGTVNGVTYSAEELTATIRVTDDRNGNLTAVYTQSSLGAGFVNTYESEGTLTLTMNKEFTGRPNNEWLDTDKFQFEVVVVDPTTQTAIDNGDLEFPTDDDGIVTLEVTKDNQSVTSPEITIHKEGTYKFNVREITGTIPGVTYDSNERIVTVTAVDGNDGAIDVSYTVADVNNYGLTFKNKYDTTSTQIVGHDDLIVEKEFDGRGDTWLDTDAFTFTLSPADLETTAAVERNSTDPEAGIELPNATLTVTNANKAHAHFGNIVFHETGTFTFTVTEEASNMPGVTNDPKSVRTIVVLVEDTDLGELVASVVDAESDDLKFTNTYTTQMTTVDNLKVTKVLNGREWFADDSFTFTLSAYGDETIAAVSAGDIVLPENKDGIVVDGTMEEKANVFGSITFKKAGTYTFEIKETEGTIDNVEYDDTVIYVTVVVTDLDANGVPTGQLTASASYSPEGAMVFTNTYTPDPVQVNLEGTKILENRTLASGEFRFHIEAVTPGAPLPAAVTVTNGVGNDAGTVRFGNIVFTKDGTYEYEISEIKGNIQGITYDAGIVKATVKVDYDPETGEFLAPSVSYEKISGALAEGFTFINSYQGVPVDLIGETNLKVTKNFTGRTNNRWLASDVFTFNLSADLTHAETAAAVEAGNIVMPSDTELVVTGANKDQAFFGNITFKEEGTYKFTIAEEDGALESVTYDTEPRVVTVTVEDQKTGQLVITDVSYSKDLVFNNTYTVSGTLPVEVKKVFTGRANDTWLSTDEFAFELYVTDPATISAIEAGKVILPTDASEIKITASDAEKKASFTNGIAFKAEGTYKFIVKEKTGNIASVQYDTTGRELVVTVLDQNNNGTYTVTSTITNGATLTFRNTYTTTSTRLVGREDLVVNKTFTGRDNNAWLEKDAFTFVLAATDDTKAAVSDGIVELPETTLTVTADNKADAYFGDIVFHKPGTYTFTVTETAGASGDGIVYDTTPRTIVAVVQDNHDGTLSVTLSDDSDELTFSNKYQKADVVIEKSQAVGNGTPTKELLPVRENDVVTYTLTVTNNGQGTASNVTVTDVVPAGLTLVADSVAADVLGEDGKTLTWNLGTMTAGETKTVTFQVTVPDVTEDTVWKNVAVVVYNNPDDDTPVEKPSEEVEIKEGTPDVSVEKVQSITSGGETTAPSKGVQSVKAGDVVTYTITVTNSGTEVADDLVLTDVIPAGLTLVEGSVSNGGSVNGTTITWGPVDVAAKDSFTASFQVTVPDTEDEFTEWTNIATAKYPNDPDDPDEPGKSNPVTVVDSVESQLVGGKVIEGDRTAVKDGEFTFILEAVTAGAPMPAVTKVKNNDAGVVAFGPIEYAAAGEFVYKITEENAGKTIDGVSYDASAYYAVVKVDKVESSETDDEGNVTSTSVSYEVKDITYHMGSLESEGTDNFTFTNTYYDADVVIEKTQAVGDGTATTDKLTVREGDIVTYTLTVTNNGKGVASNVVVTDVVPEGLTFVADSVEADVLGADGKTLTWNLGELAAGATEEVSFKVVVPEVTVAELDETGYKMWKNVASVAYNNPDDDPDTDEPETDRSEEVEIEEGAPEVDAVKTQAVNDGPATNSRLEVKEGDVVTYYITVTNTGSEIAEDVVVKDTIPEGLVLVDGSITDEGTVKDGTITWNIAQINGADADGNPGTATVSFQVVVPSVKEDTVWANIATVDYDNDPEDPDDEKDDPTDPVEIEEGVPEIAIKKAQAVNDGTPTTELATVREGDKVTYIITVQNTGTGTATDVVIRDVVPEGLALVESSISTGGSLGEDGKTITWNIGVLAEADADGNPGTAVVQFTVIVPDVTKDTVWKNVATVDYDNDPEDPDDKEEDPSNPVEVKEGVPALTFEKTQAVNDGKATKELLAVKADDVVTYYIAVQNTGTETADLIKITDTIPSGLTLVEGSISNGGVLADGVITWTVDELTVGESVVVSFKVKVPTVKEDTAWKNIAAVDFRNDPSDPENKKEDPTNPVEITVDVKEPSDKPSDKPGINTGDPANIIGYMSMAILSLGAIWGLIVYRRRTVK